MKLNDLGTDRPPKIPIREFHLRHILLVATVGPLSWLMVIGLGAWGYGVAIEAGLISDGTMTFLLVLLGIVIALKLSWMRLLDHARRKTIELDRQRSNGKDNRTVTTNRRGIDASERERDRTGRRRDPAFE